MRKIIICICALVTISDLLAGEIRDFKTLSKILESGETVRVLLNYNKIGDSDTKVIVGFKSEMFIHIFGTNNIDPDSKELILISDVISMHIGTIQSIYCSILFYPDDKPAKVVVKTIFKDNKEETWDYSGKIGGRIKLFFEN